MNRYLVQRSASRAAAVALLFSVGSLTSSCTPVDSPTATEGGALCPDGDLGCACLPDGRCGSDADGAVLICQRNHCVPPTCSAGSNGCVCRGGILCDDGTASCVGGVCLAESCTPGALDCPCAAGSCGAGLHCDRSLGGGICVDGNGHTGGACLENGLCHGENLCEPISEICVHCEPGSQGCLASSEGNCSAGLAPIAGRCVSPAEIKPLDERCYTRCLRDVETPDGVALCDADGFIDGCVNGYECREGSCVATGESAPTCFTDRDCPDFQACLRDGAVRRCYSNCESTTDCSAGTVCERHVCRVPCERAVTEDDECPAGSYCHAVDGPSGVCMPTTELDVSEQTTVRASFTVTETHLELRPARPTAEFTIFTDSLADEDFEVRPLRHQAYSAAGELLDERNESNGESPLNFVSLTGSGPAGQGGGGESIVITVPPRCGTSCPTVEVGVSGAIPEAWARWEGLLAVIHPELGERQVSLAYVRTPDGRWAGSMRYFGSFPTQGLADWASLSTEQKANPSSASSVSNGFLQAWASFRGNHLTGGLPEFEAIMTATESESWRWPAVRDACAPPGVHDHDGACYLYEGAAGGIRDYVLDVAEHPIPTGAVEYPIAMNLRAAPTMDAPFRMAGVIDGSVALHYVGSPAVELVFAADPTDSGACTPASHSSCLVPITGLRADAVVGGRAPDLAGSACSGGAQRVGIPWLADPLVEGLAEDAGTLVRQECRDASLPDPSQPERNLGLAGGNPVPDGYPIRRRLRLLDGVLVDQDTLLILFEERMITEIDPVGFSAYGYMVLERSPVLLGPDDIPSAALLPMDEAPPTDSSVALGDVGASCSPELLERAWGGTPPAPLDSAQASAIADALITGVPVPFAGIPPGEVETYHEDEIYYLCVDTGRIHGGPGAYAHPPGTGEECPIESNVRFFAFPTGSLSAADVMEHSCQLDQSCGRILDDWEGREVLEIHVDPVWVCEDPAATYCGGANREDLREGRFFYAQRVDGVEEALFAPLLTLIDEAFRYRSRFTSDGTHSLGFAPEPCDGTGHATPYCYDVEQLRGVLERSDCLLALYRDHAEPAGHPDWVATREYLEEHLGRHPGSSAGGLGDGFETLYAELLVVLGDEAFTQAQRSRFDLAGGAGGAFLGSQHEIGGIDLAGIAGYEMQSLYRAAQHYQMASDRFHRVVGPIVRTSIVGGDQALTDGILIGFVTRYLDRLIGASTRKARAHSEIAKRYQSFDRDDLARRVIERAYGSIYLESVLLSQVALSLSEYAGDNVRDQVLREIEASQRRYRVALNEMREVHGSLDADVNFFGYVDDYIPMPAVDEGDFRYSNAFEATLGVARRRMDTARRFEDEAILSNRSFETDAASFQSELVRIGVTHEQRLNQLCGSFVADDGLVYPAIFKYASLSQDTALFGDPCGRVGSGDIHEAWVRLEILRAEFEHYKKRVNNLQLEIAEEEARAMRLCAHIAGLADYQYRQGQTVRNLNVLVRSLNVAVSSLDRVINVAAGGPGGWAASPAAVGATLLEAEAVVFETMVTDIELETARWTTNARCDELKIESDAVTANLTRSAALAEAEAHQYRHRFALILAEMQQALLEAQRIQEEQARAEQLAIDVESARNDPNIRVYRNAAILTADETFYRALQHAYRATRMFEYFTSQSYPAREELYLIRMVSHGYYNLETYLDELEDEYEEFRAQFRTRANRVQMISVARDVFQIPLREDGRELSTVERAERFHERFTDPQNLNASGAWTIPFSTNWARLSPCTFNHQISHIEVQFMGTGFGDDEADVLLWQDGTGAILTSREGIRYHRLPASLVVANPYFNRANTVFDPSVYRRYEMRERPFVNSDWRLSFDQHNNLENQDIDLARLEDIVIYVYYTDFTDPNLCQ